MIKPRYSNVLMVNSIQKKKVKSPLARAVITTSSRRTRVSVMIVPPMITLTGSILVILNRLMIGYEIRVWVENILATKSEAIGLNPKTQIQTIYPITKGTTKVNAPNTILFLRDRENVCISSSNPARNIRYINPTVPRSSILPLLAMILKPDGPSIIPDIINPMIPGIFKRVKSIGIVRITKRTIPNTITGSVRGK